MPSPLGHVIAGLSAGWLVAGPPRHVLSGSDVWRDVLLFGGLAVLPDVDLAYGGHRGITHSIGAAVVVGVTAWVAQQIQGRRGQETVRLAVACMAAYATHILLDWLAHDTAPPVGIVALWPFSSEFYESSLHLFRPISRKYTDGWRFVRLNALAVLRELIVLVPMLMLVVLVRSRRLAREPAQYL